MRNILGAFLFRGDMVFQHISSLSGGERARLSLLKLILSGANLLLLDEPTNHLDIMSKEIFEKALADFPGAALIVSHDRYLLKKIPDRIVELTSGGLVNYPGGYDYYLEKRESLGSGRAYINTLGKQAREDGEGLLSGQRKVTTSEATRQRDKAVRTEERRKEREIAELEAEIKILEEEMNEIEAKMSEPEVISDYNLLGEYGVKLKHLKEELDHLYEKWTDKHI
jgi:ATP-binding cassette subfamily F protein 3